MLYQLGALIAVAKGEQVPVAHISFHAAMGNMVNRDPVLADLMMDAIRAIDASLIVFAMPGSIIADAAARAGLKLLLLFLADRAYNEDGKLVQRGVPGAVIKQEDALRARVRQFLKSGTVTTIDGTTLAMPARSILVHSDTPGSLELARIVRSEIEAAGAQLAPASEIVA